MTQTDQRIEQLFAENGCFTYWGADYYGLPPGQIADDLEKYRGIHPRVPELQRLLRAMTGAEYTYRVHPVHFSGALEMLRLLGIRYDYAGCDPEERVIFLRLTLPAPLTAAQRGGLQWFGSV